MANGSGISSVNLVTRGRLYEAVPLVRISDPTAEVKKPELSADFDSNGRVTRIDVDSGGTYYSTPPSVTISAPNDSDIQGGLTGIILSSNPIGTGWDSDATDVPTIANSGVGVAGTVDITVDGFGGVNSVAINHAGKNYQVGDIVAINGQGDNATFAVTAIADRTANAATVSEVIVTNNRVSSIILSDSGDYYADSGDLEFTISGGQVLPSGFRAHAIAEYDSDNMEVSGLYISDSGDFYISAPTITIDEPLKSVNFIIGEELRQDVLPDGCQLSAEVAAFSDSDQSLSLIHVGSVGNEGHFHEPTSGYFVTGQESLARGKIATSVEEYDVGDQNLDFSTEIESFLDFSESNPFGEPSTSEDHEH